MVFSHLSLQSVQKGKAAKESASDFLTSGEDKQILPAKTRPFGRLGARPEGGSRSILSSDPDAFFAPMASRESSPKALNIY